VWKLAKVCGDGRWRAWTNGGPISRCRA
jgi:hypothetical protein